ncbi:unnamed protein product [Ixodes pacificus]
MPMSVNPTKSNSVCSFIACYQTYAVLHMLLTTQFAEVKYSIQNLEENRTTVHEAYAVRRRTILLPQHYTPLQRTRMVSSLSSVHTRKCVERTALSYNRNATLQHKRSLRLGHLAQFVSDISTQTLSNLHH